MDYKKYKWFYTKSGKLVYGGKSALQNEKVLKDLFKKRENFVVMHTKIPGSPFAVIDASIKKVSPSDLEETAVWTACFSRAWRSGLHKTHVDIFTKEQLMKKKTMKTGTFGVSGTIDRKIVKLKLALIIQKGVLRAVPESTLKKNTKVLGKIVPGKIPKEKFAAQLAEKLEKGVTEVLNALPTGGFKKA
jgi:hypothetical protein